jgi:hypothetical protein
MHALNGAASLFPPTFSLMTPDDFAFLNEPYAPPLSARASSSYVGYGVSVSVPPL